MVTSLGECCFCRYEIIEEIRRKVWYWRITAWRQSLHMG